MDPRTLTLYFLTGGLSLGVSAVLLVFARLQPQARLAQYSAFAILLSAVGFVAFGLTPILSNGVVEVGANLMLLSAWNMLYSGFEAYFAQRAPRQDRFGWTLITLTALPFAYWGLVEPNGSYRAALFSFSTAILSLRVAIMVVRVLRKSVGHALHWALAGLFALVAIWMTGRGIWSMLAPAVPASVRGANPTSWITVAVYIVVLALLSGCILWIEVSRPAAPANDQAKKQALAWTLVEYFRHKLLLLWAVVAIAVLVILSEAGVIYTEAHEWEEVRLTQATVLTNDALVQHTLQVISQADTIVHSVRSFYQHTRSLADTDNFISSLPFDRSAIDNVYLIDAQGKIVIAHDPQAAGPSVADRDYFVFHQAQTRDRIFIGAVESGRVTGAFHFRVTRRITRADGSFGGIVLATVNPDAFTRHYKGLVTGGQNSASLLGTLDHKFRARAPELPASRWQEPLESPLWSALAQSPVGTYRNTSSVDNIERIFVYKRVGDLPLVMVTGFSAVDLRVSVQQRMRWLTLAGATLLLTVLTLAALLTKEIRRRDEQDKFMSMLSHELKTPLSVLRMALEVGATLSPITSKHAKQAVHDMNAIVERCLQAGRIEHRRHVATQQSCRLHELLAELRTASPGGERLHINLPDLPALPSFTADVPLLRIALHNLMDNALKYSAADSAVQIAANAQVYRHRNGILVSVSNAPGAAGMPDPRKVFAKYYRSPGAHSKTGSGLGLFLVQSAVRELGGWVRYAPEADRVRFELWLPT